ncbi:MAG: FAD-binding protein, partial [bacterium]|nr:FAD-binding protein [bacterium]
MNSTFYDVIVVGSGFGGSASAYALSKAGFRTLLLERGDWVRRDAGDWSPRKILIEQRYKSASAMQVRQYGNRAFQPTSFNEVVGGMSVFYGGASLRLREKDFDLWPISYSDLEPHYDMAEQMLEVHGEAGEDPFEPSRSGAYPFQSIELTAPARRIYDAARALGHRPFHIPLAINFSNPARTVCIRCITCDGFPCKVEAKNDLTTTFLARAQAFDFEMMPGVIVARLVEENGKISAVECIEKETGKELSFSAKAIIL